MTDVIALAKEIISKASVTPEDNGCQTLMCQHLEAMGFKISHYPFNDVKNFFARRGNGGPLLVFAGHTDVVPTGPLEQWTSPPFEPVERNGQLYGRGAADMKGPLAAMIVACKQFIAAHPEHKGSIGFLITSDEEGPSLDGTVKVVEHFKGKGVHFDYCIVGEPTSVETLGDMIKVGRRGSLSAKCVIHGTQGHIAYPHLADNPIHKAFPALTELTKVEWDQGYDQFQPTSFQFSNVHAGTGAGNVIPGDITVNFNFRYNPAINFEMLTNKVESILTKYELNYTIDWAHSGKPFLSTRGELLEAASASIQSICSTTTNVSTSGGTSDARFITDICPQIIELGPVNSSIHQVDECVGVEELRLLVQLYENILSRLLS